MNALWINQHYYISQSVALKQFDSNHHKLISFEFVILRAFQQNLIFRPRSQLESMIWMTLIRGFPHSNNHIQMIDYLYFDGNLCNIVSIEWKLFTAEKDFINSKYSVQWIDFRTIRDLCEKKLCWYLKTTYDNTYMISKMKIMFACPHLVYIWTHENYFIYIQLPFHI